MPRWPFNTTVLACLLRRQCLDGELPIQIGITNCKSSTSQANCQIAFWLVLMFLAQTAAPTRLGQM